MKTIKKTMTRIEAMLVEIPETRDDDKLMLSLYWMEELKDIGIDTLKVKAWDIFQCIHRGQLTNADYIARCRRRLQQQKPHLRGKMYNARYAHQETAQNELGYDNGN